MAKSTFQRLIDAGVEFTNITRKQAESIVKQMVNAGDVRKSDADKAVQELLSRGRETSDKWNETVQRELTRQVNWMWDRFDELEDRFENLAETLTARSHSEFATSWQHYDGGFIATGARRGVAGAPVFF